MKGTKYDKPSLASTHAKDQVLFFPSPSFVLSPSRTNIPMASTTTLVDTDTINNEKDISFVEDVGLRDVVGLDPAERARLLRKVDWQILPVVSLLYLLCFL
jgi:hypothetical protein